GGNQDKKAWKDIWGCGQGIGAVDEIMSAGDLVAKMIRQYETAKGRLLAA
ncbi:MAG: nitronate monooxygenase, partial [Pseudomonadota bacterium]